MDIIPIATASATAATGNPSITHGFTILSGDVLVITINGNGAGQTMADNNGGTPVSIDHSTANPDSATFYVMHRVCGAGEPATYNFTAGSSNRWSLVARQYRGVDPSVWEVAPSGSTVATGLVEGTAVAPAITISTNGACGLVLMGDDYLPTSTTFVSIDNGYGNTVSSTGQEYQTTSDKLNLTVGTTGETTITSSDFTSFVVYQVALKPLADVAPPTSTVGIGARINTSWSYSARLIPCDANCVGSDAFALFYFGELTTYPVGYDEFVFINTNAVYRM